MSLRGKRAMGIRGEEGGPSKRRKTEQEELWQLRHGDLKMSSIYNRSAPEAPAELFRKDLISAMKLPDSEVLTSQEYWIITDTWKQEWERGVQVPVNPDSLPAPTVHEIENPLPPNFQEFKLPKNKYIHLNRDAYYQPDIHQLSSAAPRAEAACKYDLDAVDCAWLKILNGERARAGSACISEDQLERVMQELELRCWDKIQALVKSEEGLGIEYDENVICDVCRSPDSEEGNEMVFCDACNICVHQACYGITTIPSGQWLCRPCGDRVRPSCVLCPNLGGAMKCTPSGHKWAHVSCVLWIPEVSIGCAERMEPITKISAIPSSRWSLHCVLCREKKGACIQCSVKTCKTAYHVTCAFKHGLEMRAIIEDENADDGVKLRSYCQKHSVNSKKEKNSEDNSEEDEVKRKRRKDMTSEEKSYARAQRLHEIEGEFDKHVSIKDISTHLLDVDQDAIGYIYSYWKLKRRAGYNRPLLPPKADDSDLLSHRQEQADLDKMKMFVQLRQDLERVRNLCYMVSRREKLSRSFFRMREQTFHKQVAVLSEHKDLAPPITSAVIEANHGPSIYDKMYSHPEASDNSNDFEAMMARIAGLDSEDEKRKDFNGIIKAGKIGNNPYKKLYVNGSTRRSGSMFSGMSSEESAPETSRGHKYNKQTFGSSTEEDEKPSKKKISPKNKAQLKTERKRRISSRPMIESSSEEDLKPMLIKDKFAGRSKPLKALQKELNLHPSGTDSDDFAPSLFKRTGNTKCSVKIYTDSSDENNPTKQNDFSEDKSPNATNDSTQPLPRTKAAMKQFIPTEKLATKKESKSSDDEAKNKENIKSSKIKEYPTDLIVPQRQAAKKASENMRSTTKTKDSEVSDSKTVTSDEAKVKSKQKIKSKDDKVSPAKDHNKKKNVSAESSKLDKEKDQDLISYVPERQAAKKAAAHIKSGLGNKPSSTEVNEESKKKETDPVKQSPVKDNDKQSKSSSRSSSSSTSNSSSSSCSSSSSSEDEDDKSGSTKSIDARTQETRPQSIFSPVAPRPSVDLPFLDKVSRPLSSSSASSDSESTKEWEQSISKGPSVKGGKSQQNESSSLSDEPSNKAPDTKFKTSERRTECRVSSQTTEGEKRSRTSPRPAPRSRTRSTASSGNLFDKRDSGPRKSIAEKSSNTNAQSKSSKQTTEPSESPTAKWKTNEGSYPKSSKNNKDTIKEDQKLTFNDNIYKSPEENKEEESSKRKSTKSQKLDTSRRISVSQRRACVDPKSPTNEGVSHSEKKDLPECLKASQHLTPSPIKSTSPKKTKQTKFEINATVIDKQPYGDDFKVWSPISRSPLHQSLPEDPEKYTNEEKSLDDRSSFKMIAKIQANLNENTMIKSPKTPMDATSGIHESDVESNDHRHGKRSSLETNKKFTSLARSSEANPLHSIDTNKKIPQDYGRPSIFSPQPKDNACSDIFDFGHNILAVDDSVSDGFGSEEILKRSFPFNSECIFKEDSKEDRGVQETLNLVQKLRMTLSSKKAADNNEQENARDLIGSKVQVEIEEKVSDEKTTDLPSPSESTDDADKSQPSNTSFAPSNDSAEDTPQDQLIVEETQDPTPEVADQNKWHYAEHTSLPHDAEHQSTTYEDKNYIEKQHQHAHFDNKEYENKQYADKIYEENRYHDKRFQEKQYDEKHYDDRQYDEKRYNDKEYDDKNYDKHYRHYQVLPKHPMAMAREIQCSNNQDHFIDSISKKSDESHSIIEPPLCEERHPIAQASIQSQGYENNNSLPQSDCATTSPYRDDDRHESKWGESKITQRRSSASSTNSEGSMGSQNIQMKPLLPHGTAEMIHDIEYDMRLHQHLHPTSHQTAHPPETEPYSAFSSEASQFVHSSVSLFQPGPSASLPFTSPGAGYFPPNLRIPYNSNTISSLSKPYTSMCDVYATPAQNLVLNSPMVDPPASKSIDHSPPDDMDLSTEKSFSRQPSPTPSADSFNDTSSVRGGISKLSNDSNDTVSTQSTLESRSSTKPMRTSSRFIGSGKSPGKSPGFSPKTAESIKSNSSKRSTSSKSSRGRGRGRSKSRGGQSIHGFPAGSVDYQGTIHSKLMGTVYELDFDKDTTNQRVDLKSMRDRRRSIDIHDKKSDTFKDSSQSPQVPSPPCQVKKAPLTPEIKEGRTPIAINEISPPEGSPVAKPPANPEEFPAIVQPVLPGAVHMRQYQPPEREQFNFGSFEAVTAHQSLEFDEESEKELQKRLASNPPGTPPKSPVPEAVEPPPVPFIPEAPMPKVSLSDSRNQLKVKIKGPFRDANYCASIQPVVPQPPQPVYEPPPGILGAPSAVASVSSAMLTGTSSLRRMRKKELLRQYWTQDMNMDDPAGNPPLDSVPPPIQQSTLNRTIITIPKAVASMTTIPTREDYKAVVDANMEKKKRKATGERELRHLEVNINDESDNMDDLGIHFPSYHPPPAQPSYKKGRGRATSAKPNKVAPTNPITPKLKIKIGTNIVQPVAPDEPIASSTQFRPPKKRLAAKETVAPTPSYEDLRRESMKFRKIMMAEFDDGKKERKHKPKSEKPEKKKKKKEKKSEKLKVINTRGDSVTKLVIKISRNKEESTSTKVEPAENAAVPVDPFEYDPSAPDPLAIDPPSYSDLCGLRKVRTSKVTPIRLKLARSSEGSGYVMKDSQSHELPKVDSLSSNCEAR